VSYIKKLNKKLKKRFDGEVEAREEDGLLILSGSLPTWSEVVLAGMMSVNDKLYHGLVNDIDCTGEQDSKPRMPSFKDYAISAVQPDVLIIGGGVIGCAIARELSRYKLDVLLVEKEHDLAMQTSGRNDGLVHAGIDLKSATQKYSYNMAGNKMFGDVCNELGVEFKRPGQYICFESILWKPLLYLSLIYWSFHGLQKVKVLNKRKLLEREPAVGPNINSALYYPSTGMVSPYNLTIAYAENAVQNGARVSLDTAVLSMEVEDGFIRSVSTNRGKIHPKIVINAAGVFCEDISKMAEDRFYSIHPRKGTSAILDKKYSDALVQTAASAFSTASTRKKRTKGGGVIRTVDGNVMIGPDAVETIYKEDFSTNRPSVLHTIARQNQTAPVLSEDKIISYFSGIRACTYEEDFVVRRGMFTKNIIHAAGIQSPGLTAAPAIGVDIAQMAVEMLGGEATVGKNFTFNPVRNVSPNLAKLDATARAELIKQNPDYGIIICRCEEISRGEILDAMRRNIPCDTLDGVKRRVRPGMGRCQGGFCGPLVLDIISKEKNIMHDEVRKSGENSQLLFGGIKPKKRDRR